MKLELGTNVTLIMQVHEFEVVGVLKQMRAIFLPTFRFYPPPMMISLMGFGFGIIGC